MIRPTHKSAAFTLVEVIVGMSLALIVMSAVLSSYSFLGRNLFRLLNQQTLQTQARSTLQYFQQDVRMASGISGTPSARSLVLILPTTTNATTTVTYTYDSTAGTLTRAPTSGNTLTLLSGLTSCSFSYYDASANTYTSTTLSAGSYLSSIKQIALSFTSQTGTNTDGTLAPQTASLQINSPRVSLRNQVFLQ